MLNGAVGGAVFPLLLFSLFLPCVFGLAGSLALGFVSVTMATDLERRGTSQRWLWGRRGGDPSGLLEATVT